MFNTCPNCGEYRVDKTIDPSGPFAICPVCQEKHRFVLGQLFAICGPSGAGKSTVCAEVVRCCNDVVALEGDLLWREPFKTKGGEYYELWLRMGKNIAQSGRPLALFSAGSLPEKLERCQERRYFSKVSYLALVCDDDALVARLGKPGKRRSVEHEAFVEAQLRYNRWFRTDAERQPAPIEIVDTTDETSEATAARVLAWLQRNLSRD